MKYSWEGTYCEEPSWEGDPEGLCILHSTVLEKDKKDFDQALQTQLARVDFDFREVYFPGPVSFPRKGFKKFANFYGARFAGWADFREARFVEGADFSHARFAQAALFEKARFGGQVFYKILKSQGKPIFAAPA
jgi:uncharacterized protein YjbI with pentapeptide repeats